MNSLHGSPAPASTVVIGTAALLLVSAQASAATPLSAPPAPAKPDVSKAPPVNPPPAAPVWIVDKAASRIGFQATLGGQTVDGVFKSWDAQIAFDPKNLKASHALISVEASSAMTGQPTRDALLPTPAWLSAHKFPKATLISRSISQTGPGRYLATADLKLRGVTRRVSVPFTVTLSQTAGRMLASMMLDRTTFGIGQVPGMRLTSLSPVVKVTMRLTAKKEH
jgi:polyisoprenoid-binding protein YceI